MTSPLTSRIMHHANEIYEAIQDAVADGYVLRVDGEGRLDLLALLGGEREPIVWITMEGEN